MSAINYDTESEFEISDEELLNSEDEEESDAESEEEEEVNEEVNVEVAEEDVISEVEEEIIEEEEEVEDEGSENENVIDNEDEGVGIDEILEDKPTVNTRKCEFVLDKNKIRSQMNDYKYLKTDDLESIITNTIKDFTPSEKNINIFSKNILSKEDIGNIMRFMYNKKELSLKEVLECIKTNNHSFNGVLWEENREELKKEVIRLQTKINVVESYIACPKCKQKKIQFYNVQLRRADEPPTTFNNCMNKDCMYSWRTG
jgi:DNA-directed RNA polymerase subunit M/transcription elongation factor TFIIS